MLDILKKLFGKTDNNQLEGIIKEGAYLVDVRTPLEFADGHIRGSVNIPLDKLPNQLSKFKGKEHIVVFCRSGMRSGQAKNVLNQHGFTNVTNGGSWNNVNQFVK